MDLPRAAIAHEIRNRPLTLSLTAEPPPLGIVQMIVAPRLQVELDELLAFRNQKI